ncbi:MAG: chromosome segregation protein SMC [Ruminococcaceae bacterium]|nr:chromosome segregation protein SMC [Oscillospiraceae bacterium]
MYLKALEMQGFKSFPDKTVLKFDKGMTGVVGPNGSGKSNISDAVRWVLGEQSTKSLRGSKMEDVIFSGTRERRPQGFAEVTLRLDNADHALQSDETEVSVTRRYYRSGESQYQINGNTVRLRDVHELFMDTGLGRDGYSMVSQGKIEDMVSAKSADRRDMFEEAAGISHYRYRRADALRRLNQAEDNLVRLRDILTELQSRVGPLAEQSRKAQKFLVLAEEKKELEIGLWLATLNRSQDQLREQSNRITVAREQYNDICRLLEEAAAAIDSSAEESRNITLRMEELRDRASLYEEQAAALDAQAAVGEANIRHNDDTVSRLQAELGGEEQTRLDLEQTIAESQHEIDSLRAREEQQNRTAEGIEAELTALKSRDEEFSDEYNAVSRELDQLSLELSRVEIMVSSATSSVDEIAGRMNTVQEQMQRRNEEIALLHTQEEALQGRLHKQDEKVNELNNTVTGFTLRLNSRKEKAEKKKEEYENKKLELSAKQSRLAILEDTEKSMEGYQGSVKAVMREVRRGNLTGIHGTLSQLISVEDAYTTAIETALGNAIQDIVSETENDAKRAIAILKSTNAGRATFLPLSAVRGRSLDEKGLYDCYGFISLAPDLVSCDDKYREIISSLLGKTVVAEDLDCAIEIAKKYNYRFKIVTLDGQVINAGGSMTGGSRIQNAGFISRANEIDRLKTESTALAGEIAKCSEQVKKANAEFSLASAELEGAQADLMRANEEKLRIESDLKILQGRIAEASSAVQALEDEKKNAAERTDYYKESIRLANEQHETLLGKKQQLTQTLHTLSGGRDDLAEQREQLTAERSEVQLHIMEIRKDIDARRESIEMLRTRLNGLSERRSQLEKEIAAIEQKTVLLRSDVRNQRDGSKALREEAVEARTKTKELAQQRVRTESAADNSRAEERRLTADREKVGADLVRLEERLAAIERDAQDIERKLYEEYGLTRREAADLGIELESHSQAQKRLSELKHAIKALGSVNVAAIEEYKEVSERYTFLSEQVSDAEKSKAELLRLISELTENMAVRFRERFAQINESFKVTFAQIFNGGSAELILEDESDILECGIEIKAQPPGKNVRNLSLLSGGEKGLCAIALLFAILKVTPAPFCIFDEVEAALDDVNVARFAQFVRGLTNETQFILITHRRGTMEEADVLYGVTMQEEGVSKLLELHTAEMAKQLGLEN